jgi:hypothetical protein
LDIQCDKLTFNLHHRSLRDIVAMHTWYSKVQHWQALASLRPIDTPVRVDPAAWWRFAIEATRLS